MSSSDTTPVHSASQEREEPQALDPPDSCTELEVIRSAGGAGELDMSLLSVLFAPSSSVVQGTLQLL